MCACAPSRRRGWLARALNEDDARVIGSLYTLVCVACRFAHAIYSVGCRYTDVRDVFVGWPHLGRWSRAGREVLDGRGRYIYMNDLLELDRRRPSGVSTLPEGVGAIATPLRWEVWAKDLRDLPDREYARYIVEGIRDGFRIGFDYSSLSCSSVSHNMLSAKQHPQPIRDYLAKELKSYWPSWSGCLRA